MFLFSVSSSAQATYDNNGLTSGGSKSITVPAGYNRLLVVHASTFGGNRSASFNGMPMTEVITKTASGWVGRTTIFVLPLGTGCEITANVSVSSGGAGGGYARTFWTGSFQHVNQTTPISDKGSAAVAGGTSNTNIGGLTNVAGMDLLLDGLHMGDNGSNPPSPAANGGGTVLYNNGFSFGYSRSVARLKNGPGGNASMSWNVARGWRKPHVAVVISGVTQQSSPLDTEAPVASCKDVTLELEANGSVSITPSQVDNGSTDNCGIQSLTLYDPAEYNIEAPQLTSFDCAEVGAHAVLLEVTDNFGNISTCTSTVTVEDNLAPSALCNNLTVQVGATGTASITTADINAGSSDNCGIQSLSLSANTFNCNDVGNYSIQLNVTDQNGNSSSCSAVIIVEDMVPPTAQCQDITVQLDVNGAANITPQQIDNGSSDVCGAPILGLDMASFDCGNVGSNTITLSATDQAGNVSTCTANVMVENNNAPVAACKDVVVDFGNSNGSINLNLTPADVNDGSTVLCGSPILSLSVSDLTLDCNNFSTPQTTILTVTDENGNSSTCTSSVYGFDQTPPTAECKNLILALDGNGSASIAENAVDNGSSDVCGIMDYDTDIKSFDCNMLGANAVQFTVTDIAGNTATCSATITVEDQTAPTAVCLTTTVQLEPNGNYNLVEADVLDVSNSNDICGIESITFPATKFTCDEAGHTFMVPVTVADGSGNSSNCTANITVAIGDGLPDGWAATDIGNVSLGNGYTYDPCEQDGQFTVMGSGNNAVGSVADHVAFSSQLLCGDGSITAKIESVTPNGYGGLMIRETTEAGAKQAAIFSNLSNVLRHEVRYQSNGSKQVNSFSKPAPYWLRMERQGDWVFTYYSSTGSNFQFVHAVMLPMQECVEIGLASFTYLPNAQTTAVFSNVSTTGNAQSLAGGSTTGAAEVTPAVQHPETAALQQLQVFPNPAREVFHLQMEKPLEQSVTFKLYNAYGQLSAEQQIVSGSSSVEWRIGHLPAGTYWIVNPATGTNLPLVITNN